MMNRSKTRFVSIKNIVFVFCLLAVGVFCAGFVPGDAQIGEVTFFGQFFVNGGPIVWFLLFPMSIVTIYFAVILTIRIRRSRMVPDGIASDILTQASRHGLSGLATKLGKRDDLVSRSVVTTLDRCRQFRCGVDSVRQLAAESLQEQGMKMLREVEWCHLIGSVAPMVGLFGTVFGMIRAFEILGVAGGQPQYDLLAASISVALVTTFWGLLVAIPALFLYGIFRTRVEAYVGEAAMETDTILSRLANGDSLVADRNSFFCEASDGDGGLTKGDAVFAGHKRDSQKAGGKRRHSK